MNLRFAKLSATVFGVGYLPIAPGTWASLVSLGAWYLIFQYQSINPIWQIALISLSIVIGLWSSIRLEKEWGKDPSKIVIDEWAGMWITLAFLPVELKSLTLAFIVFRILDIWKPLFIRRAERFKGGWGVMMDDIFAGIIGNIFVRILLWI
ncbi:MAG: phosphatidylglycerophosphatase A [Bacteroidia bacterium]|nr:phosphatidylglycerophosphatase A [Bacteroidia bacterium]